MWTKDTAAPIVAALGNEFRIVGSVATRGQSKHDLDILRFGMRPFSGDPDPRVRRILKDLGFEYTGQSTLSPEDKRKSHKRYERGWSEIHHFEHSKTHQRIEIWTTLKT
jgi:hypothetical protein